MHILIVGAGIGGLCLAQGLKKAGIKFTIWERNPDPKTWLEGYRIHINPIGSRSLFQCLPSSLWQSFLFATADKKDGIGFLSEKMELILKIENELMTGGATEEEKQHYAISRIELRRILMVGLQDAIIFGRAFERFKEESGKVVVFAEGNAEQEFDLLVGADGANSKVRRQFLPQAERIETDAVAIAGKTFLQEQNQAKLHPHLRARMNVVMPVDKYFFFSSPFERSANHGAYNNNYASFANSETLNLSRDDNYILWSFIAGRNELESVSEGKLIQAVVNKMENWDNAFKQLVKTADPDSVIKLPLKSMLPVKAWRPGRVTLLGDAIHNMTPVGGMGANMALHDAAVLVRRLIEVQQNKKELKEAVGEYEKVMRDKGFRAVKETLARTKRAIDNNRRARKMAKLFFKTAQKFDLLRKACFTHKWWEVS